jgi:hypothetical protein
VPLSHVLDDLSILKPLSFKADYLEAVRSKSEPNQYSVFGPETA